MANLDLEIQQLNQQRDGLKVYKQIQKLTKKATASSTRLPVVQALLDYAEKGSSVPHRSIALSDTVPLLDGSDTAFESILYRLMERPKTTYWSMDGLMKVIGRDCYPVLAKFALNGRNKLDNRAKAIEVLCQHAHLPWIEKLPDDPGECLTTSSYGWNPELISFLLDQADAAAHFSRDFRIRNDAHLLDYVVGPAEFAAAQYWNPHVISLLGNK